MIRKYICIVIVSSSLLFIFVERLLLSERLLYMYSLFTQTLFFWRLVQLVIYDCYQKVWFFYFEMWCVVVVYYYEKFTNHIKFVQLSSPTRVHFILKRFTLIHKLLSSDITKPSSATSFPSYLKHRVPSNLIFVEVWNFTC